MQCSCTAKDPKRSHDLGVVLFCPYPDCDRPDGPHASGRGSAIAAFDARGGHLVLVDQVRGRAVRRFAVVTAAGQQESVQKAQWSPGDRAVVVDLGGRAGVAVPVAVLLAAARDGIEQVTL